MLVKQVSNNNWLDMEQYLHIYIALNVGLNYLASLKYGDSFTVSYMFYFVLFCFKYN